MGFFGSWLRKNWYYALGGPMFGVNKYLWDQMHHKTPTPAARVPQFSSYGQPLPIVYGRTRITGNVVYFKKSLWSDHNGTIIALCEGPVSKVTKVWKDQRAQAINWTDGATTGIPWASQNNSIFRVGSRPTQSPWPILAPDPGSGYAGDPAGYELTYPGVAYVGYSNDTAPESLAGYSWEVWGLLSDTGSDGDAHPATAIFDYLTNTQYGCGVAPYRVEVAKGQDGTDDSGMKRYTEASDFWISPVVGEQRPAREHLREWLDSINCEVVWSDGKFKFYPYCDGSVTGNGVTYTPDVTVQYDLTNADFLDDENPIEIEIEPESERWNAWPVEFLERAPSAGSSDPAHAYNVAIVESAVPMDAHKFGRKAAPTAQLHAICRRDMAQKIAQVRAAKSVYQRATYKFRLGWRFCRLEPFDLVRIPFDGLTRVVRITEIAEDADFNLTITAEDWPFGVGTSAAHDTQSSEGSVIWTDTDFDSLEPASRQEVNDAQDTANQAAADAANALTLAGSGTHVYSQAAAPTAPPTLYEGDLWFSTDTTTTCPVAGCTGTLGNDGIQRSPATHRGLYWAHRYHSGAWTDAHGTSLVIASEIAAGAIVADKIAANTLKTSNYAEDGSGNPTAGAKLDHTGTALKVAAGNLQIGSQLLTSLPFAKLDMFAAWIKVFRVGYWDSSQTIGGVGVSNFELLTVNGYQGMRLTMTKPSNASQLVMTASSRAGWSRAYRWEVYSVSASVGQTTGTVDMQLVNLTNGNIVEPSSISGVDWVFWDFMGYWFETDGAPYL